jgi:lipopolysaccharide export system protein LptC
MATAPTSLSFIQPRDNDRTRKARRTPRIANFLRVALPTLALVVLLALLIWPALRPNKISTAIVKNIPDLVVDNLHFTGTDSKDQAYSINAVKATRPQGLQNIFDLDQPKAEITMTNGVWLAVQSQQGRYDQDSRKLWLGGDVQVFHDQGYQFTSDELQVDMKENYAFGNKPVLIQGSFGEITGQGFRLLEGGQVMIVKGPARAILALQNTPSPDKPVTPKTLPDKATP